METQRLILWGGKEPANTHTENANMTARAETLNYLRAATVKLDGADGFLYIHHWATGWQELVFQSHAAAARFLAARDLL